MFLFHISSKLMFTEMFVPLPSAVYVLRRAVRIISVISRENV